ncbi:MAG: DUF4339 domain-containing protein [Planctomycetes bacterium]|jgi:hypothetical protein|nr:DUF4339 domain-containing protein [Planctomycetota bacterium]
MAGQWYYMHAGEKSGPFTGQQLADLATSGVLLRDDTILKQGNDSWVLASRVRNLFPVSPAENLELITVADVAAADGPEQSDDRPILAEEPAKSETYRPAVKEEQPKKKGVASALKGADIVGQDGVYARYRMKCTECGHKDASCRSIAISNKVTKSRFFCRKCKKGREVVIQCRLG